MYISISRKGVMMKNLVLNFALAGAVLLSPGALLYAQVGSSSGGIGIQTIFDNPLVFQNNPLVCGDVTQAGTAIAGDADGADNDILTLGDNGTSGQIPVAGIPATAKVAQARLYWTVLTDDAEDSFTGAAINFNGTPILGTKIATSGDTPCFPQENTLAYRADVTALVPSPGNGTYTVSGFPGGNAIGSVAVDPAPNFTEGTTLQIMWSNESTTFRQIASYEASGAGILPVSLSGDTLTQTLGNFLTNAAGAVSGKLYEVVGNGQNLGSSELVDVDGLVNLNDTLDGSSAGTPAETCSYTDSAQNDCFWDDDAPDISAALTNADTSVTYNYTQTVDCHDFPALVVSVSTDLTFGDYCEDGGAFVDAQCPAAGPLGGGTWANHGDYVSCVSEAANAYLANNNTVCSTSCIVNPRARSNVGRGGQP